MDAVPSGFPTWQFSRRKQFGQQVDFKIKVKFTREPLWIYEVTKEVPSQLKMFSAQKNRSSSELVVIVFLFFTSFPCQATHRKGRSVKDTKASLSRWRRKESLRLDLKGCFDTVDGRNRAPVDMVNIALFLGFYTSQVAQDLFHQQYGLFL